ncbi:hypothetical protein KY284_010503 [Solanum tuberosum]|nr:hypothetical protein KY284_010503 [Solanum tuberosum]
MESQDEQNPMCSSSNIVPTENESQMPPQTNEATNEVIEIEQRRFTSKAWQHFKPVKVDGFRFSVCRYCSARIKSTRNCGTTSMLEHFRRCPKKPINLITEGGSELNDGRQ